MTNFKWITIFLVHLTLVPLSALAFTDNRIGVGAGYYSENFLNEVSNAPSGEKSLMGVTTYPLLLSYTTTMTGEWFVTPQFGYTVIPRSSAGDTAKVTITTLGAAFGQNFSTGGTGVWDWNIGPRLIQYSYKGSGGTKVMNNGTTTATFAVPGRSVESKKLAVVLGTAYNLENSRFGFDLLLESAFSSAKRTQSFMLSYSYLFGGSF